MIFSAVFVILPLLLIVVYAFMDDAGYFTLGNFAKFFAHPEAINTFVYSIGVAIITSITTWNKNNHSPRLNVSARVVAKRTEVSHHQHPNNGDMSGSHGYSTTSSTSYYVTFEVDSGDRIEFSMSGSEYGMLIEGDAGTLNFQGTRYLGFERK